MRAGIAGAIAAAALLLATSDAVAQRDASDRGQRLDSDAFRNDMQQNQLKKPDYRQNWQAAPAPPPEEKPKRSYRKRKSN
jgi:hypothetical protein